jgi:hypothetical protein
VVDVELSGAVPRGVLFIYAGGRQVLREPFDFRRRVGLFQTVVEPGRVSFRRRLTPGATSFVVYVAPAGQPAEMVSLDARLASGGRRILRVRYPGAGKLSAGFD